MAGDTDLRIIVGQLETIVHQNNIHNIVRDFRLK